MSELSTTMRVRDVMQIEFDLIDGMKSVADALRLMKYHSNATIMVEKRSPDDEYGMLLISDIARHVIARDRNPERVNVYEIMAKPVLSVHPDMSIKYCSQLLQRFDLSRVPVVENRQVVGLVSFEDLVLRGLFSEL